MGSFDRTVGIDIRVKITTNPVGPPRRSANPGEAQREEEVEEWLMGVFRKGGPARKVLASVLATLLAVVAAQLSGVPVDEALEEVR